MLSTEEAATELRKKKCSQVGAWSYEMIEQLTNEGETIRKPVFASANNTSSGKGKIKFPPPREAKKIFAELDYLPSLGRVITIFVTTKSISQQGGGGTALKYSDILYHFFAPLPSSKDKGFQKEVHDR
ncbi:hypothetical protein POVWA2_027170 [Plasmodium ovale wallikeri]|uniref:Uncharacterized protein n=1 Tax=Plasmodium ovale wallikeri TaxID=864142 RepID=A0A1A8YW66_PLAOA|nr:hypothetical protein POVWA1_029170 [Plasmodium ovale wallikeri]SBT35882.1 hypothetical protein POVWA2_027170 [Plasmodium ovale wallikeri]